MTHKRLPYYYGCRGFEYQFSFSPFIVWYGCETKPNLYPLKVYCFERKYYMVTELFYVQKQSNNMFEVFHILFLLVYGDFNRK